MREARWYWCLIDGQLCQLWGPQIALYEKRYTVTFAWPQ